MKLHSIRQDLQDYQDSFCLIKQYLVDPVDPVKKIMWSLSFSFDQTGFFSGQKWP